jgi:hypothetical protein
MVEVFRVSDTNYGICTVVLVLSDESAHALADLNFGLRLRGLMEVSSEGDETLGRPSR